MQGILLDLVDLVYLLNELKRRPKTGSARYFLYAFIFQIKRSNRHPLHRTSSGKSARLRGTVQPPLASPYWPRDGVNANAFEGSFRAGRPVEIAGLRSEAVGPNAPQFPSRAAASRVSIIQLKSNFFREVVEPINKQHQFKNSKIIYKNPSL